MSILPLKGLDPEKEGFDLINEFDDAKNEVFHTSATNVLGNSFFKNQLDDPFKGLKIY